MTSKYVNDQGKVMFAKLAESLLSTWGAHVIWGIIALVGISILGSRFDRAIDVLERMDDRVEQAFAGAAPIGKALVGKGIESVTAVDAKTLGEKATARLTELLEKKPPDSTP